MLRALRVIRRNRACLWQARFVFCFGLELLMYFYFASSLLSRSLQRDDVGGLQTLGTLLDVELDALALF